jgi:hypothetical protein
MSLLDRDIREPLFEWLEANHSMVRILEEIQIGRSRADVVAVTEQGLIGMEIKSDADTYARLPSQVINYDAYYDANFIVIGLSHLVHIREHVPSWWGIITSENDHGKIEFYMERHPQPNPMMTEKKKISILWRPELNHILERAGLPAYRQKSKDFVQNVLLEKVNSPVLWHMVTDELFERDYTEIAQTIRAYRTAHGKKPRKKRPIRRRRV